MDEHPYITCSDPEQWAQKTWSVVVPGEEEPPYSATGFGVLRCRLWGLVHRYGWLPVRR